MECEGECVREIFVLSVLVRETVCASVPRVRSASD